VPEVHRDQLGQFGGQLGGSAQQVLAHLLGPPATAVTDRPSPVSA
jgi:hypothetical protein